MKKTVIETIDNLLLATGKSNIEELINEMHKQGFYTARCHRHHHYKGGLADHALQTRTIAIRQWEIDCQSGNAAALSTKSKEVDFASLLHDICNFHGYESIHGHGRRSSGILKENGIHLNLQEFLAIRFHMGLKHKESHFLYPQACTSYLRSLIETADKASASKMSGYEL